jgi:hypothetical protein
MKPITSFAIAAALAAVLADAPAQASDLSYQCTNTASGASWLVEVDDQKRTVDGVPADISAARISWRDAATGGSYDLDRKSGDLTFTNSSSMGGYMLWHRCQQK